MNDELPSEERLRRIEHGVQRRIDARRASRQGLVRGVTGVVVAALVVGGGFALLRTQSTSTSSGSSGSAAQAPAPTASADVVVTCHGTAASTTARVDPAGLPASALAACASAGSRTAARPNGSGTSDAPATSSSTAAPAAVLCRAEDGALHVYRGGPSSCGVHGMAPYRG